MATIKGKGKFVSLLLLHGEKVAIGLVGVIALWFIYKSLGLPRLGSDYQADKLESEITQTSNAIKESSWDKVVADQPDKVKKVQPIADKGDLGVKIGDYVSLDPAGKPRFGFENAIVAPMILREDPVLLNAIDVRATGSSGLFAFVDEEIRKQQQLRLAEQQAEAEKKALADQKKAEKAAAENTGRRGGRGPDGGPGEGLGNQPIDPAHPKRRQIQSAMGRPGGMSLQGGERIERAYWACVTAKVPIREQLKLYQDALEKARGADPTRDFPSYVAFFVERAEVIPGKELEWKAVPLFDGQQQSIAQNKPLTGPPGHAVAEKPFNRLVDAAAKFWAVGLTPDVIDERFAEYPLTLPLPPLIGREWGTEATHPDIPLAINTPPLEPENEPAATETAPPEATNADPNAEFGSSLLQPRQGPAGAPGFAGRPGGEFAGMQPGGAYGRGRGGPEGMMPGMGPGMGPAGRRFVGEPGMEMGPGAMRGGGGAGVAQQHTFLPKGVDYYLLRFFDFTVEPGKKYKYRVKLVLSDPNFGMPQAVLAPAALDRQAKEAQAAKARNTQKPYFRMVEKWSDPSPSVGIPMAGNVRLADVKLPAADRYNDEPSVKLLVEGFDADETGTLIQGATERDVRRGYVANLVGDAQYQPDPTMVDVKSDFKFFTGMTLLDVDGGGKLVRDLTVPSRVLVMGPAGEMYIRNELDDKSYVQNYHAIFNEQPANMGPDGPGGPPAGRGRSRGRR